MEAATGENRVTDQADDSITRFAGEYAFLSNFWPCEIEFEGQVYPGVEQAFQAAKTLDQQERQRFTAITPGAAKKAGRKVALRPDWQQAKVSIMRALLRLKFSHPELREKLLATGSRALIEGNTWGDRFWGVCRAVGQNMLGKLLMEVREDLRSS